MGHVSGRHEEPRSQRSRSKPPSTHRQPIPTAENSASESPAKVGDHRQLRIAQVQALQAQAGNRAVTGLFGHRGKTADSLPSVQRKIGLELELAVPIDKVGVLSDDDVAIYRGEKNDRARRQEITKMVKASSAKPTTRSPYTPTILPGCFPQTVSRRGSSAGRSSSWSSNHRSRPCPS